MGLGLIHKCSGSTFAARRKQVYGRFAAGRTETAVDCSGVRSRIRIANTGKTMNSRRLVDGAVEDGGDLAHFVGEDGKFFGQDGLHAVGEGFVRLVMDFDEQAIGTNGDGSAGQWENLVALASAVAGIDEDGQVAALLDGGDHGEVERVA